jgi:integrase/recombinase XerD
MNKKEKQRFNQLYERCLKLMKIQGMAPKTIEAYARGVRRIMLYFDCVPDKLTLEQLEDYFAELVNNYSWSTIRCDKSGLMFFWKHVLKCDWQLFTIIKPPKVRTIPDVLSTSEVEQLIINARELRYRVFILTTYSMGLRLDETLSLQVGDIDSDYKRVHIRRGKGHKDRLVPLPDRTLHALRLLWQEHRHPKWIFPNYPTSLGVLHQSSRRITKTGAQSAMKAIVKTCKIKKKCRSTLSDIATPPTFLNAV